MFPQRDRKFSISVLTQSTEVNADCCGKCESALIEVPTVRKGPRTVPLTNYYERDQSVHGRDR